MLVLSRTKNMGSFGLPPVPLWIHSESVQLVELVLGALGVPG